MYQKRDAKPKREEIKFEEVYNGKVFETVAEQGKFYMKGCSEKSAGKTDGIYAVELDTGIVTQPLMESGERREQFNHLYIYPGATYEV